jgi:hypothetical protein
MMVEDAGEALELFYQCRCGDYFSGAGKIGVCIVER